VRGDSENLKADGEAAKQGEVEQRKNVREEDRVEHAQRSLPDWHRF